MTWMCICINSFGGLLVAAIIQNCIMCADNVSMDVAPAVSILVVAQASQFIFSSTFTGSFLAGAVAAVSGIMLFADLKLCDALFCPRPEEEEPGKRELEPEEA